MNLKIKLDGTHLVSIDPEFDYWENQSTLT